MKTIRLTYECPCSAFDVLYADVDDWNQGGVVIECSQCHRTLHQLDGFFQVTPNEDIHENIKAVVG